MLQKNQPGLESILSILVFSMLLDMVYYDAELINYVGKPCRG